MDPLLICTHCGFTWDEYRARGLLGCAHCYAAFGESLQADVAWLHQALALVAPETSAAGAAVDPASNPEEHARWRVRLAEAVRAENYEEAARIKALLGGPGVRGPGLGLA
jgi:protein arginine kinase activator